MQNEEWKTPDTEGFEDTAQSDPPPSYTIGGIKIKAIGVFPEFQRPQDATCDTATPSEITADVITVQEFYLPIRWWVDPAVPRSYLGELTDADFEIVADDAAITPAVVRIDDRTASTGLDNSATQLRNRLLIQIGSNRVIGPDENIYLTLTLRSGALPKVTADPRNQPSPTVTGGLSDDRVASQGNTWIKQVRPKQAGYQPTLGDALNVNPPHNRLQTNPAVDTFIVPIVWGTNAANMAGREGLADANFQLDDVVVSSSGFSNTTVEAINLQPPQGMDGTGVTDTWYATISLTSPADALAQAGTVTVGVRSGALPEPPDRYASRSASRVYSIRLLEAGPVIAFFNDPRRFIYNRGNIPNRDDDTFDIIVRWSVDTRGQFAGGTDFDDNPDNVTFTSSTAGVSFSNTRIVPIAGGRVGQDYIIGSDVSGANPADAINIQITVAGGLISESATRFASRAGGIVIGGPTASASPVQPVVIIAPAYNLPAIGDPISFQSEFNSETELNLPLAVKHGTQFKIPVSFPRSVSAFSSSHIRLCAYGMNGHVEFSASNPVLVDAPTNTYHVTIDTVYFNRNTTGGDGGFTMWVLGSRMSPQFCSDVSSQWATIAQGRAATPRITNWTITGDTVSGYNLSFVVEWDDNVTGFETGDISLTSSDSGVSVNNPPDRVVAVTAMRYIVTTGLSGSNASMITATIQAGAIPETNRQAASAEYSSTYCWIGRGVSPSFGTPLQTDGSTALTAMADGESRDEPISNRDQFILPITWPESVCSFTTGDISLSADNIELRIPICATNTVGDTDAIVIIKLTQS